jgi:hypothetical protein
VRRTPPAFRSQQEKLLALFGADPDAGQVGFAILSRDSFPIAVERHRTPNFVFRYPDFHS